MSSLPGQMKDHGTCEGVNVKVPTANIAPAIKKNKIKNLKIPPVIETHNQWAGLCNSVSASFPRKQHTHLNFTRENPKWDNTLTSCPQTPTSH